MYFIVICKFFSIIKASESIPNNSLTEERNVAKNGHSNSTDPLVREFPAGQSESEIPISPIPIIVPETLKFDQELVKLKEFGKFIDPSEKKLINPDDFKIKFEKIKDITKLIDPSESQILNSEEVKHELKRLKEFIKFFNVNDSEPFDPLVVEEKIGKLIEINEFVHPNGGFEVSTNDIQEFLKKLKKLFQVFVENEKTPLNFQNVFEILEKLTELSSIINLKETQTFKLEDTKHVFDVFKKFTEEKSFISTDVLNSEDAEQSVLKEFTKFCEEKKLKQPENSFDPNQEFDKFKKLAKFYDICDSKPLDTKELEKKLDKELERLKNISLFMDQKNDQIFNIKKFGQELEKFMNFAQLIHQNDPPILNYEEVESQLTKLQEFSNIIKSGGSKLLNVSNVEEKLEKLNNLAEIINTNGLQTLKIKEIENELERLDGLVKICDLNKQKPLTFDNIERELKRLTELAKVINKNQPQSLNLEDVESKLKEYFKSANLTTDQQITKSDKNESEQQRPVDLDTKEQSEPSTTDIKENLKSADVNASEQNENGKNDILNPDNERSQGHSAEPSRVLDQVQSQSNNDFGDVKHLGFQSDDPNVYLQKEVDKSRVVNQPGNIKKSVEKFKELVKSIKNEIKIQSNAKVEISEEVRKLINLSETELLNLVDIDKKTEILYEFTEHLKKNRSSNTILREEGLVNLYRSQNQNKTSNFRDGKLEHEVARVGNEKLNKTVSNHVINSQNGQKKHEKFSNKSEYEDINRSSKSQRSLQVVNGKTNREYQGKKLIDIDSNQSKKSKINREVQSINNLIDFKKGEFGISDQLYGDDPNAYNSVEIAPKLAKHNPDILPNNNEHSQSLKQESAFYNPQKLLLESNHGNFKEKSVVGKSQGVNLNDDGEVLDSHFQNESKNRKNIRKLQIDEFKVPITLYFTFTRSL